MSASPLDRADRLAGDALERVTYLHHRRRLARLGWSEALDPPAGLWCAGDPPPRPHNNLEVLIDGALGLPRIAAEIAAARSHVHVIGWHVEPEFRLRRGDDSASVRELLHERAKSVPVRVLAWAGPPIPVFNPKRRDVRRGRARLCHESRIQCALDAHERPFHCHHDKVVVVDDRVAFVGGIDLTSLGGDRFDSSAHAYRGALGWHDATTCLHGPAVIDVAEHFRARWQAVTGEQIPAPAPTPQAGDVEVQVIRTLPDGAYDFAPRGDFRILEAYIRALRSARRLVYLENQFLWSPELVSILADKLRDPPTPDFRIVVILPARANNGADDTRGQLSVLAQADDGAGRFLACTLYARDETGERTAPVYVHAKIGIVDDEWLTVGSANINAHSLFNDGELNLLTRDSRLATDVRRRLWAEHLEVGVEDVAGDPATVIDERFKPIAARQLARRQQGLSLEHRLVELPGVSKRSMRLLGPLQGLVVDG